MHHRYVPILRWKRGERTALKVTNRKRLADVIPLILVTDETFKDKPEKVTQEGVPAPLLFADDLFKVWGNRSFYLEASGVPPAGRGIHPLIATAKQCRESGMALIPAIGLGAPAPYEAAVMQVAQTDRRGVALKVSLREFSDAANWIGSWPHSPGETDLIVDLADKVTTISDLGSTLDATFRALHRGKEWRTVTVAGTSMPENFGGRDPGLFLIERAEVSLWHQLLQASLPYRLDFSDYATIPIVPPPTGIKWGYPINVRYTLPRHFLICRGVSPTRGEEAKDLDVQLIAHANSIKRYKDRHRLSDCWADIRIDKIADEEERPGNLENWVTIGVNRHIELTRSTTP